MVDFHETRYEATPYIISDNGCNEETANWWSGDDTRANYPKGSIAPPPKKTSGHEPQEVWREDEVIAGKPPVVK
jgi:hypothetical protein